MNLAIVTGKRENMEESERKGRRVRKGEGENLPFPCTINPTTGTDRLLMDARGSFHIHKAQATPSLALLVEAG